MIGLAILLAVLTFGLGYKMKLKSSSDQSSASRLAPNPLTGVSGLCDFGTRG